VNFSNTEGDSKMQYAWICTKDKLTSKEDHESHAASGGKSGLRSRVGWIGPRTAPDALVTRLKAGEGIKWRCRDDDDNIYYYGLLLQDGATGLDDMDEHALSAPLDNFAMPDAGAVKIEHFNPVTRKWEYVIG